MPPVSNRKTILLASYMVLLAGLFVLLLSVGSLWADAPVLMHGEVTYGTVIGQERSTCVGRGCLTTRNTTVEFKTSSNQTYHFDENILLGVNAGESYKLVYDRNDPWVAVGFDKLWTDIISFLLGVTMVIIGLRMIIKNRREEQIKTI